MAKREEEKRGRLLVILLNFPILEVLDTLFKKIKCVGIYDFAVIALHT